jgi:hypothetical protein
MSAVTRFVFRRRGGKGWHWTDVVTWAWLVGGLILMFGPAVWLVGSSLKTSWICFGVLGRRLRFSGSHVATPRMHRCERFSLEHLLRPSFCFAKENGW